MTLIVITKIKVEVRVMFNSKQNRTKKLKKRRIVMMEEKITTSVLSIKIFGLT